MDAGIAEGVSGAGAAEVAGGALAESEAVTGISRLAVAPEVASAAEGDFGAMLQEVASGRAVLTVEQDGLIRAGTQGLARLEGDAFYAQGRELGYLRDGYLYQLDNSTALGRLRGTLPGRDIPLEFTDGVSAPNLRPMIVDVLRLENGRYLIRLANGSEAWIPMAALFGITLVGAADAGDCDPSRGEGVVVRTSGEPISFSQCERQDDVLVLQTANGPVVLDPDEAGEVIYGSSEIQLADSALRDSSAG
jgi:hypothetical protein